MGLLLPVVVPSDTHVAMQKCCPLHQRLDQSHHFCEDDPHFSSSDRTSEETSSETLLDASALEEKGFAADGFPFWMDPNISVWNTSNPSEASTYSLLEGLEDGAQFQLGPEPPCPLDRRKFFRWESKKYRLLHKGHLLLRPDNPELPNIELLPQEYCVDNTAFGYTLFMTCPCDKLLCVKKCCGPREELEITYHRDGDDSKCVIQDNKALRWKAKFYDSDNPSELLNDVKYVRLDFSLPVCPPGSSLITLNRGTSSTNSLKIFRNGSVLLENFGHGIPYRRDDWCADESVVDGNRVENVIFCQRHTSAPRNRAAAVAYGLLFLVSSLFLSLTLLVYALVPELRRTAYSRSVICHVASLLVASVTIASGQLSQHVNSISMCRLLGFTIQYSMLAAFFWLNVLCIDVAWAFKVFLPAQNNSTREWRKFLWYSLYGWGSPLIITIITVCLEFAENLPESVIRPDFGRKSCWMETAPAFAFFYGPMLILLLMNVCLYGFVAAKLIRARKDTAMVRFSKSKETSNFEEKKEKWILHAKLFLLMGVTWIMECVSAAVGHNDAYWYATDTVNMLRGVFVFVIFCCKKDVWKSLEPRLPSCCRRGKARDRTNGSQDSGPSFDTEESVAHISQQYNMSMYRNGEDSFTAAQNVVPSQNF